MINGCWIKQLSQIDLSRYDSITVMMIVLTMNNSTMPGEKRWVTSILFSPSIQCICYLVHCRIDACWVDRHHWLARNHTYRKNPMGNFLHSFISRKDPKSFTVMFKLELHRLSIKRTGPSGVNEDESFQRVLWLVSSFNISCLPRQTCIGSSFVAFHSCWFNAKNFTLSSED